MTFVCLWSPHWATAGAPLADLAAALLKEAPRVATDARGVIWADARGLPAPRLAWALLERLRTAGAGADGGEVRAGVSAVPVAAEVAARSGDSPVIRNSGDPFTIGGPLRNPETRSAQTNRIPSRPPIAPSSSESGITFVEPGHERAFLAPLPIELLQPDVRLHSLLDGVGIRQCGELAALDRGAVEARFGGAGAALWRLSRADDPRLLFSPIPSERPGASMDFIDYAVSNAGRLVFTANALLGSVCETLRSRGERARAMTLAFTLSGGEVARRTLRCARPTAERSIWLRRIQGLLERWVLPDSVTGVGLQVERTEAASATQGDIFDRGFATAGTAAEAVARLVDEHGEMFFVPETEPFPLAERRSRWLAREPEQITEAAIEQDLSTTEPASSGLQPCLTLQLLAEPRRVAVRVRSRRDHLIPTQYLDLREDREWKALITAAGPDRISGGHWEAPYAREYFRCVTESGTLVWLFRDAVENLWFLHGKWD